MPRLTLAPWATGLALLICPVAAVADTASDAPEAKGPAASTAEKADKQAPKKSEPPLLTIGSMAPALDIEHWVQNGDGKFSPVTDFTEGQVYVVEFWATWCPPCVASMPHLAELQQKYVDQGVTIVSVSDEPLERVTKFLDRPAKDKTNAGQEGDPLTFRDVTKPYCLTTDPDGSVGEDYMRAARQDGIPCAFVVGKDGRVEWIGHPMQIDDALEQVVAETWDRDVFAIQYKAERDFNEEMRSVTRLARRGRGDQARAKIAELVKTAPNPKLAMMAARSKMQVEFTLFQWAVSNDQAAATEQLPVIVKMLGGETRAVGAVASAVARQASRGDVAPELLNATVKEVEAAIEADGAGGPMSDLHARLVYAQGDLDRAIEIAESVYADATGRLKKSTESFLEKLKAERDGEDATE
ncbi:MAG: TlpA disulfide reductase family protein [Planctomycetota bacterium]